MATQGFNWSEFQVLAHDLVMRTEEASVRSAISRSYYYVYHLAKRRLIDNQFFFVERQDTHKQVWDKFSGSPDHNCRKLAEIGKRLKEKRERADYEPYFAHIQEDAPALVELADQFARTLLQLAQNLPKNTGVRY